MLQIPAGVFKARCLGLLDEVEQQRKEIVITKRGRPVARLVPVSDQPVVVFGRLKGSGRIVGDIFSTGAAWDADA
jgi:prevent-host-death family protein